MALTVRDIMDPDPVSVTGHGPLVAVVTRVDVPAYDGA
jgi:hypothetical protein